MSAILLHASGQEHVLKSAWENIQGVGAKRKKIWQVHEAVGCLEMASRRGDEAVNMLMCNMTHVGMSIPDGCFVQRHCTQYTFF